MRERGSGGLAEDLSRNAPDRNFVSRFWPGLPGREIKSFLLYKFYSRHTIWAGMQNDGGGLMWAPCGLLWPGWHNQTSNSAARPQGARARRTITMAILLPGRHRTQEEQHVRTRPCRITIAILQPGPHRTQEEPHVGTRPCRIAIAIPTSAQERPSVTSNCGPRV